MSEPSGNCRPTISDYVGAALAVLLTLGLIGLVGIMCFVPLPEGAQDALMFLLGSLSTGWLMVLSYYFGSSADVAVQRGQARGGDS